MKLRSLVLLTALVFFSTLAVQPASAVPSFCRGSYTSNNAGYSLCTQGTGEHRASGLCADADGSNRYTKYGAWRPVGTKSYVQCGGFEYIHRLSYQLR